jgi:hypothetical protein
MYGRRVQKVSNTDAMKHVSKVSYLWEGNRCSYLTFSSLVLSCLPRFHFLQLVSIYRPVLWTVISTLNKSAHALFLHAAACNKLPHEVNGHRIVMTYYASSVSPRRKPISLHTVHNHFKSEFNLGNNSGFCFRVSIVGSHVSNIDKLQLCETEKLNLFSPTS